MLHHHGTTEQRDHPEICLYESYVYIRKKCVALLQLELRPCTSVTRTLDTYFSQNLGQYPAYNLFVVNRAETMQTKIAHLTVNPAWSKECHTALSSVSCRWWYMLLQPW